MNVNRHAIRSVKTQNSLYSIQSDHGLFAPQQREGSSTPARHLTSQEHLEFLGNFWNQVHDQLGKLIVYLG